VSEWKQRTSEMIRETVLKDAEQSSKKFSSENNKEDN
jgi:hypothetical protein